MVKKYSYSNVSFFLTPAKLIVYEFCHKIVFITLLIILVLNIIIECNRKRLLLIYSDFKNINDWWVNFKQVGEKLGSRLVQKVPKVYNKRIR